MDLGRSQPRGGSRGLRRLPSPPVSRALSVSEGPLLGVTRQDVRKYWARLAQSLHTGCTQGVTSPPTALHQQACKRQQKAFKTMPTVESKSSEAVADHVKDQNMVEFPLDVFSSIIGGAGWGRGTNILSALAFPKSFFS